MPSLSAFSGKTLSTMTVSSPRLRLAVLTRSGDQGRPGALNLSERLLPDREIWLTGGRIAA